MKIEKDIFVVCRSVAKDMASDEINLLGLFDGFRFKALPGRTGPFKIVARFSVSNIASEQSLSYQIKIQKPTGEIYIPDPESQNNSSVQLQPNKSDQSFGFIVNVGGLDLDAIGIYKLLFFIEDQQIDSTLLQISLEGE